MITLNTISDNINLLNAWANAVDGKTYEAYLNRTVEQDIDRATSWLDREVTLAAVKPSTADVLALLVAKQQADAAPEAVPISEGV